ncbi:MAG: RidA family protein [Gammaproteobacteria bacterium]|nr:MAG: RidA family protein [Gammaproteobacteria bacterium]UCH41633.1 MAG: RidA family protein [Gammaproteobacteria bacterium]
MSITRHHSNQRMSQIVIHGDTVYLAGQVADDASADITVQTEQVLQKIDNYLAEAGSDRSKILSAQVWIASMGHFAKMNEVWDAWVPEGQAPARACIEARLASPDLLVEIGIIAAR